MAWASSSRVFHYDFANEWALPEYVSLFTMMGIFDDAVLFRYIKHPEDIVIFRHSRVLMWAWLIASSGWWGGGGRFRVVGRGLYFSTQYYSHTGLRHEVDAEMEHLVFFC
jgi:hypothetical protein